MRPALIRFELHRLAHSRTVQAGGLVALAAASLSALCLLSVVQDATLLPAQSAHFLTVTLWPYCVLLAAAGETATQGKNSLQVMLVMSPSGRTGLMLRYFFSQAVLLFLLPTVALGLASAAVLLSPAEPDWLRLGRTLPGLLVENFLILLPCVGVGLFWSVVCPGPASAGMCAAAVYLLTDLFKNRLEVDAYFFSSLYDKPFQRYYDALSQVEPEHFSGWECMLLLAWTLVPLLAAWSIFRRKDLF